MSLLYSSVLKKYGNSFRGSSSEQNKTRLFKVQKKSIRNILKMQRPDLSCIALFKLFKIVQSLKL